MNAGTMLPNFTQRKDEKVHLATQEMTAGDRRLLVLPKDRPPRTSVPTPAPLALGAPMQLERLPWLGWSQNALSLLALSLARWIGR